MTEPQETAITQADLFIASPEYQGLQEELLKDVKSTSEIVSKMTPEQLAEYETALEGLIASDNYSAVVGYAEKVSSLTGIDFMKRARKLSDMRRKVFQGHAIPMIELVKAQQKYSISSVDIPRTKSGTESDDKDELRACYQGCSSSYGSMYALCTADSTKTAEEIIVCTTQAYAIYKACTNSCDRSYGK